MSDGKWTITDAMMTEAIERVGKIEAENERLKAINAELLAACKDAKRMYAELAEHAQAGRPAIVPVTIVLRLNAAIANAQPQGEK